jgi:hypothetical protein
MRGMVSPRYSAFKSQRLSVEPASGFGGPKLLLNNVVVKKRKGSYPVMSDSGSEVLVKMKYNLVDPIPTLSINDQLVGLAEPLQWYEYGWSGLPMLLVFVGGALGGLVGGYATVVNGRIFRSDRSVTAKYGLAGAVTVSGVLIFFVLAVAFRLMWAPHK